MSNNLPPSSLPPQRVPDPEETPEEKAQYSLDEMMKALREKEREKEEKGEVVTRSDGSVARKVKRRRRRSDQPEIETPAKEGKRLLTKVVVAASVVLIVFLAALFLVVNQNSRGFREKQEQIAAEWTGAEVAINGMKRMPLSATIDEVQLNWGANSFVKDFNMKRIEGDVNFSTFLGARPGGLQLGGAVGQMAVQLPASSETVGQSFEEGDFPFRFEQYYCQALDVNFGEKGPLALRGVSATLRHLSNEGYQATIDQGFLRFAGWKDFPISNGLLRFKDDFVEMKSLTLEPSVKDEFSLGAAFKIAGNIPLASGEKASLAASTGQYPLHSLVGENLARFFEGSVIGSEGTIQYTIGEDELDELQLKFTASEVQMQRLPFLTNLQDLFPDQNFDDLKFNGGISEATISGTLRVLPEGAAIERLEMSMNDKVRLKGGFIIAKSGALGGAFEISINRFFFTSQARFANSPLLRGSEQSGFVKLKFQIGGTVTEPDDTFRQVVGMESTNRGGGSLRRDRDDDLWDLFQPSVDDEDDDKDALLTPDILRDTK